MLITIIIFRLHSYFKCFFTPCLGVVFGNILTATYKRPAESDLALTLWVQTVVSRCAERRHELKPLELFLQTLNHYAHLKLRQRWPNFRPQANTHLDCQSSPPTATKDQRTGPVIASNASPSESLHEEELEFLDRYGIGIAELSNKPFQTVLLLEKSILTAPDPHRQWWTFES